MSDFAVGRWRIRLGDGVVTDGTTSLRLEPRIAAVLEYLVRHAGRPVSKDELVREVWGDVAVSDGAVVRAVVVLRRCLGDDSRRPRYIRTLPKRGYQFIAPVRPLDRRPPRRNSAWWAAAPAVALATLCAAAFLLLRPADAGRLAIEPFQELDPVSRQEHWKQALTDGLAAQLSSVPDLDVALLPADREDGFSPTGLTLTGSVQREGSRARVSCRLTESIASRLICAASCDLRVKSRLDSQQQAVQQIAAAVRCRLQPPR